MKKIIFILTLFLFFGIIQLLAAVPTNISDYTTSEIVKTRGDAGSNVLNIQCTYIAYKKNSCSNDNLCVVGLLTPASNVKKVSGYSSNGNCYWQSSHWLYSYYKTSGDYIFFDLQAISQGIWTLAMVQTNAGDWYYYNKNIYTITFKNTDGVILQTEKVISGDTPIYSGATPTKVSTAEYAYTFKGWTPEFVAATSDATYTAVFDSTKIEYTIDVIIPDSIDAHGNVTIEGEPTYGDTITITAVPEDGWYFEEWSDGNTDNPREIVVTGDTTLYPVFKQCEEIITQYPQWITVKELSDMVGTTEIEEQGDISQIGYRYVLKDETKLYTFSKIRIDFSQNPPNYYNFFTINYSNDKQAMRFSHGDYRVFLNGAQMSSGEYISHSNLKKKGEIVTDEIYEFDMNTILGTSNETFYVVSWQYHFLPENFSVYATKHDVITWKNFDGEILEIDTIIDGTTPIYSGITPSKPATAEYTYTFSGWNPEIETVTGDAIYTAVFDSTAVINGGFSVSTDRKVYFSPGNLQYQASTDTWRFAEHQWDYVGDANLGTVYEDGVKCNNALLSSTYSGWIDLFGYSTATTYYGVSTSKNNSTYAGEFVDWGQIFQSQWRTLTRNEWEYLLNKRPNHASLFAFVRVEGVKGLLLLPDNFIGDYNITTDYNYSSSEFASLEALGAIFLPANGYRDGTTPKTVQTEGEYYANTSHLNNLVDGMQFGYNSRSVCSDANNNRYDGRGVRLVKDIDQNANDSTQVDSDSTAMATNLNMIYIKGDSIEGFSSNKYTYTFTYSAGTNQQDLPSSTDISWDFGDEYQTVTATQAGNTIVLTVISGRGLVTTYVLSFVIERPNQYTVTTLSNNDAWGITIGGNVYNANSNVSIGAFANDGYQFYHWNNTITDNPYTFQLTQDTSFVATFLPNTEEEIITDVTSNSVHMEWEVKPWGNHGYWVWIYLDKDHKQWYCKMRFYADGTLSKFYWGPASKHYDASNPPLEIPVFRAPQRYFDATTISYDLSDIEEDLQYFYTIEGVDEYDNVISVIAGTFKTPAYTSDLDNVDSSSLQGGDRGRLILHNGQILILRGEKIYTLTGQEVK